MVYCKGCQFLNLTVKLREIKENMEKEEQQAKTIIKNL